MLIKDASGKFKEARILLFSQRNIYHNHYRCANYEFEDIVGDIDSVEILAPRPNKRFKYGTGFAQRMAVHSGIIFNPGIPKIKIKKNYDLFFAVCTFPRDLLQLSAVEGWREQCGKAICWLNEIWISEIRKYECYLRILAQFDSVMVNCSQTVDGVNAVIGGKCFFAAPGIDAILFSPYPEAPQRVIDVYSIGRRSPVTHEKIIRMMSESGIFYVYDTIRGEQVLDWRHHRLLFANMAKRSRYFIVNPGKIDCPEQTDGQSEIGTRYFEGAASGAIMIGEIPTNEEYKKLFSWPDAVVHLPFGSDHVDKIIKDLDKQPDKHEKMRKNNVVQSLLRNDWAYRWESVLKTAGLEPMPELLERKKRLENLSRLI